MCAAGSILLIVIALVSLLAVGRAPKTKKTNESKSKETGAVDKCCCASCGTSELDDGVKLKPCHRCDLVKYCSDACQRNHRPKHKKACKKRAAELRDEILFRQPEYTHMGDCPICSVPLPVNDTSGLYSCCCKRVCYGCDYTNELRQWEQNLERTCPFCRHVMPSTQEEADEQLMKRVAANDPVAFRKMGIGCFGREKYDAAFKYFTRAADLGDADSHYALSIMYLNGQYVEKDESKELHHAEEAAIRGHPAARHNLGVNEVMNGRVERAVKHLIIAANLGWDESMKALKVCYKDGDISKEDFAAALRAHHAAVAATKSPQRAAAEKAEKLRREKMESTRKDASIAIK